jgi:amino acid adenylation domain-containing protein
VNKAGAGAKTGNRAAPAVKSSNITGLEVAVIGMAGRFPGAANIEEFWKNLKEGVESISFFSEPDMEDAGVEPQNLAEPVYIKAAPVIEQPDFFDAGFFEYTSIEAKEIDPQMRILMECAWTALEHAGYNPDAYEGLIGIFAGSSGNFQWEGLMQLSGTSTPSEYYSRWPLIDKDFLTANISYKLDLKGPSTTIYTACSTSLVALHMACRSVLAGECKIALAGGVSISMSRKLGYRYHEGMILSPDGHCRAFDARANGTVFGDGAGIVVVKRLKHAIADGDYIYAVIKGSAINNDGKKKVGYTAPGVEGQAEVIRMAQRVSRVEPESITYIETHGTGTTLGDPVEIEGLKLGFNTTKRNYCRIGSIKSNFGHLDIAAGIASFIKVVLALTHRLIPPSLHFETPNPKIDFKNSPFQVNTKPTPWNNDEYPLRAGVSSFGIGGTNAHIILEEAPAKNRDNEGTRGLAPLFNRQYQLILLSAKTQSALDKMTENIAGYLKKNPGQILADAAYTLHLGRKHFRYRRMTVASTIEEATKLLSSDSPEAVQTFVSPEQEPPLIFMFSGQGSQYMNMGLDIYRSEPVFREESDRCFDILDGLLDFDIKEIIYPINRSNRSYKSYNINQTQIAQPALFIFEYALAKLLTKWGLKPYAMIGHSIGEFVAACLAGVFSLGDALKLVVMRGKLMQRMAPGSMLSVSLSEEELKPLLNSELALAAVNSTAHCVVSGSNQALDAFAAQLQQNGHQFRRLHTSHAFHSEMMTPILEEFKKEVSKIALNKPGLPYIANVSGKWITAEEATNPGYWSKHLRQTVRFYDGITELLKEEKAIFVEIGPGRSLVTFVRQHINRKPGQQVINLTRHPNQEISDMGYLVEKVGQLWLYGKKIDVKGFYAEEKRRRISLPTYPYERQPYGIDSDTIKTWIEFLGKTQLVKREAGAKADQLENKPAEFNVSIPRPGMTTAYVEPGTGTEKIIAGTWKNLMGIEAVGIYDDFFELGGDSLKAITVIGKIQQETNTGILLTEFFNRPTIKELAQYIDKKSKDENEKSTFTFIKAVEKKAYYRLSSAQNRLYILHRLDPAGLGYNLPVTIILEGKFQREKLAEVFEKLIRRHESFRTFFRMLEEEPVQRILPAHEIEFAIEYDEVKTIEEGEPEIEVKKIISKFVRPFNLEQAPLMRAALIKLSEEKYFLVIDIHHIISDGTSQGIFFNELGALAAGKVLPGFNIQYKDYAEGQNNSSYKKMLKSQERYWTGEFSGEPPVLHLPVDYNRPAVQSFEGAVLDFELDKNNTHALRTLARDEDATLYMILLSLYYILLAKISGQEDIVLGTPVVGRKHPDLQHIIGIFINSLALWNYPEGEKTFREFLREIKHRTLEAFDNQDYPFEDLVDQAAVRRDLSRNPFFDVMFILHNELSLRLEAGLGKNDGNLKLKFHPYEKTSTVLDLTLVGFDAGDYLPFKFEYSTKLFKQATIERFINYFKRIISSVRRNPEIKISDVKIITQEEKQQILVDFNETGADYPRDKTIDQLFEEQAERTPDHTALAAPWYEARQRNNRSHWSYMSYISFTYRELNKKSNQLACLLEQKGVKTDTIVGIMVERSIEMIIGILAILKAGGAYLPLDPAYPGERISYMLADSSARILLKKSEIRNSKSRCFQTNPNAPNSNEQNKTAGVTVLDFEHLNFEFVSNFEIRASNFLSSSLAYVIYTSGSTGNPKGTLIQHRSLVNRLNWMQRFYPLGKEDVILQKTTYTFDVSVWELLWWGIVGARVYLLKPGEEKDPGAIAGEIQRQGITTIHFVPSMLKAFLDYISENNIGVRYCKTLRQVFSSGEALSADRVEQFNRWLQKENGTYLINLYGPTEATIDVSYFNCTGIGAHGETVKTIPIGKPIENTWLYILDRNMQLQPVGIEGELYIGGVGLARGYLNRPELTAEKFDQDLWDYQDYHDERNKTPGERVYRSYRSHMSPIYKTGDLARWLPDGNIEFLGRIDHQVKIRGFRIELGEIENQLLTHEKIKEAVVIARDNNNDKYLCAYLVAKPGEADPIDQSGLREYLSNRLPDYMVPSYFVQLESIPLTPNGKIDRKALPDQVIAAGQDYTAPGNKIEKELVDIWAEVLGRDQPHVTQLRQSIGIDHNFFQLGGHSLKATILTARIHKRYDIHIPLVVFFKTPTIKQLAGYMHCIGRDKFVSIDPVEKKEYYALSSAQKRLYILHQFEKGSKAYNMPLILTLEGNITPAKMEETFKKLISRHESLRTWFGKINEEPVQGIQSEVEFEMEYLNISQDEPSSPGAANSQLEAIIIDLFIRPFDLAKAPLIRVGLRKIENYKHILMIDFHHIITDGVSHTILLRDFTSLYAGQKPPPLKLQYKEYSQWQQSREVQNTIKEQEEYWLKEFEENIPVLNLPTDYSRPTLKSFEGDSTGFALSVEEIKRLNEIARTESTTLFMVILAAYNILLAKLSSQEDIVVGIPIAGRRHTDLETIVGVFINTLAVRNYPSGEKTCKRFLTEIKEKTIKSFENQDYQLEDLVEKAAVKRDRSRNPLFDVSFSHQNFFDITAPGGRVEEEIRDMKIKPYGYENKTSKFDLNLRVFEVEEKLSFSFEYSTKLFTRETILRFIRYFKKIILSEIASPGMKISQMEIIPEQEKKQLLYDFNAGETGYPKDKLFHELFEEQVVQRPHRVALLVENPKSEIRNSKDKEPFGQVKAFGDGARLEGTRGLAPLSDLVSITYRELNKIANHTASLLRAKNLKPGAIVGIMATPSVEMAAGMIAVMKAGCTFLPIEPGTPVERINFVLNDSNINILLIKAQVTETFKTKAEIVNIEAANLYGGECGNPGKNKGAAAPVYLTYISGSGGKPAGVLITHRNLMNYIHWFVKTVRLTADDKAVLTSSFDFDALYTQLFSSLLTGCQLHILPREIFLLAEGLLNYLRENQITYLKTTPHLFNLIVNHPGYSPGTLQKLRLVVLVGEEIKVRDVEKTHLLCPHIRVMRHYGYTETTIGSIARFIDIDEFQHYKTAPSLGKPIDNTRVYILEKGFTMAPIGTAGQLFIGGDGVGIGYLNNPELTREKFRPVLNRSYRSYRSYIIFKTGDLARWLPDGNIEFLGRIDQQVTIRGYRVALAEIRDLLNTHPDIKETAVVAREREDGEKVLYAYFVGVDNQASEKTLTPGQLRNFLSGNLPDYMIPSHFAKIEKIPLTRGGKIDGKALERMGKKVGAEVEYSPPTTAMEKKIAAVWTEVLKLDKVSIHDDFFERGGNSLTVITLTSRLREIGCTISLVEVMSKPTIKELAAITAERAISIDIKEKIEEERLLSQLACIEKLNNGRGKKNIFIIHPRHGMVNQYKALAQLVEKKFNVYGVQARAWTSAWKIPENTRQVINDYLEQILAVQKNGPYIIGGFCAGTLFGYEIVRKLERMGHQVEKLILFDSHCFFPPHYVRFLRRLEYLPGFYKTLFLFSTNRRFKKAIKAGKLLKAEGNKGGEVTIEVDDDLRREKISEYMDTLYLYITPLEFIKAPILVPLVENTDRRLATEENFDRMTRNKATVVETTGKHDTIWEKPYVEKLAEIILNNL